MSLLSIGFLGGDSLLHGDDVAMRGAGQIFHGKGRDAGSVREVGQREIDGDQPVLSLFLDTARSEQRNEGDDEGESRDQQAHHEHIAHDERGEAGVGGEDRRQHLIDRDE